MNVFQRISASTEITGLSRRAVVGGFAGGALLSGSGLAQSSRALKIIVFPGGFNWPLWVAQSKGFLAQRGLTVEITPTPNSTFQMKGVIDGDFDIAMTAFDNVVAYNLGQGEAVTGRKSDLAAFFGADGGFLRLVGTPEISSIEDLKGRKLAVDALTTGYAFVLREMLDRKGLKERDVDFVRAGGVLQRFTGLMNKEFDATLLVSPFETQAQVKGFKLLARAPDVLNAYQGVVGAARREWLAENKQESAGFVAALVSAVDWLLDPANKADAISILRTNLRQLTESAAEATYTTLLTAPDGFQRGALASTAGMQMVLDLRSKFAGGGGTYIDRHFDRSVLRSL